MKHKQNKHGFTIIEVVLVLAIAGLIFAAVFLGLPALQRRIRDNERRNDAAAIIVELTKWKSEGKQFKDLGRSSFYRRPSTLPDWREWLLVGEDEYKWKEAPFSSRIGLAYWSNQSSQENQILSKNFEYIDISTVDTISFRSGYKYPKTSSKDYAGKSLNILGGLSCDTVREDDKHRYFQPKQGSAAVIFSLETGGEYICKEA